MEETAAYVHHIATSWAGPELSYPPLPAPHIPFTVTELEEAIAKIPATKAVPHSFPPGPFWKSQAPFLAGWLYEQLTCWWSSSPPFIPQAWKDAWVRWPPKPNKPATKLDNLKMLGLQKPLGKAVLQLVAHKALKHSFERLRMWPQFAYLPHRSTRDALLRASAYCQAVRNLVLQKRSVHQTTVLQPHFSCVGGIQLFLDLTRAFDALPRSVLATALSNAKLTPQLQSILLAWHIGTNDNIAINNTVRCIPVSRGVRQGCCSAPYLWSTAMVLLLNELQDTIPLQWIKDHISIYADDLHIFCLFYNEQDLTDCIYFFEAVIMAIDRMGLKLSPQKLCLLLKGKGPGFLLWKKRYCVTSKTLQPYLFLCDGSLRIPIMKKCLYLGAVMSYGDFQKQTVAVRVNVGWNNFRNFSLGLANGTRFL